jgi:surfactin synthase thioesterase subunit/malonyl CoA-acyl carrier protein transacylase
VTDSRWIKRPRPVPDARIRLFCVPHAGAGPSFFARWLTELSPAIEVCLVHLPGRESRLDELPLDDLRLIGARAAVAAQPLLDRPFALFGHSMGAIIAYEFAHQAAQDPCHLFASASTPPHQPGSDPPIAHLPDDEFLAAVHRDYGGLPDALWQDADLQQLLLPALRADFGACERYQWTGRPPLHCGISALGGSGDPLVPRGSLVHWADMTTGGCTVRVFDEGHFYLTTARAAVHQFVREQLGVVPGPRQLPAGGRPVELLPWSAGTAPALVESRSALLRRLEGDQVTLPELAQELHLEAHREYRAAVVCHDRDTAVAALRRAGGLAEARPARERRLAYLLSGVGDHYPGMGAELYRTVPVFRDAVDRCCAVLSAEGCDLLPALYPTGEAPPPRDPIAGQDRDLRAMLRAHPPEQGALGSTWLGQPAVFVVGYALAETLASWGVRPAAMIGYSLGEYVAACLAGVLSLADALRLVCWRARRIEQLPPGAMLAVALPEDEVRGWLGPDLDLAGVNSPIQSVVGGPESGVARLAGQLTAAGVAHRRIGTRHAFHTRMVHPLAGELTEWVRANIRPGEPRIPYVSNVTGTWITGRQARDPSYWARHMCQPVRLLPGLGALWADPDLTALELGAGESLCSYARHHPACGRERLALVQPCLPAAPAGPAAAGSDWATLLTSLGRLWVAGVAVQWSELAGVTAAETARRDR